MTDQILVHISASTTRQNDNLYRSLADAYLDFEPQNAAQPVLHHGSSAQVTPVNTSIASMSKDSYGSFPSNVSSGNHSQVQQRQPMQHSDGETAGTESMTPYTSRLAQLEHIHATWSGQKDPTPTPASEYYNCSRSSMGDTNISFIQDSQLAAHALQSQLVESFMTTSDSASEEEDSNTSHRIPDSLGSSFGQLEPTAHGRRGELLASASHPGSPTAPIPPTRGFSGHSDSDTAISMSHPAIPAHRDKSLHILQESPITSPDFLEFGDLDVDAFPPPPDTSINCPVTLPSQITMHLKAIKSQNPTIFRPSRKLRTLALDERGYWMMECGGWPHRLQRDCWLSLCEQVRSGRLGWGVTLHRECQSSRTLGQVRLYCWGEVVEHLWLSLWLCSEGKISDSGAKWIDAEGMAVMEMP